MMTCLFENICQDSNWHIYPFPSPLLSLSRRPLSPSPQFSGSLVWKYNTFLALNHCIYFKIQGLLIFVFMWFETGCLGLSSRRMLVAWAKSKLFLSLFLFLFSCLRLSFQLEGNLYFCISESPILSQFLV